jgi:MFS family permease
MNGSEGTSGGYGTGVCQQSSGLRLTLDQPTQHPSGYQSEKHLPDPPRNVDSDKSSKDGCGKGPCTGRFDQLRLPSRWVTAVIVGTIIFANHYTRDVVGTLEKQLEAGFPMSTGTYALLNSMYFGPNIVSPLFAGILVKLFGRPNRFLFLVCLIAAIGHSLFWLGYRDRSISELFIGRTLAGTVYEIIDTMPFIVLKPLFGEDSWSTAMGMVNSFLRLGSVVCFIVSPYLYKLENESVSAALAFAAVVGWCGCMFSVLGWMWEPCPDISHHITDKKYELVRMVDEENSVGLPDDENIVMSVGSAAPLGAIECKDGVGDIVNGSGGSAMIVNAKRTREMTEKVTDTMGSSIIHLKNDAGPDYVSMLPLYDLPVAFYWYILAASLMYGACVPFWFMGSKYLQNAFHLSVSKADSYMLIPELVMVVFSPILGILMDKYPSTACMRMVGLTVSTAVQAFAYILILTYSSSVSYFSVNPVISMFVLGCGFTLSHGFIWFSMNMIIPTKHFEVCSGLMCSSISVFPTIIPPLVVYLSQNTFGVDDEAQQGVCIWVLCATAICASLCAFVASYHA